jgi:hypothetical protein
MGLMGGERRELGFHHHQRSLTMFLETGAGFGFAKDTHTPEKPIKARSLSRQAETNGYVAEVRKNTAY